MSWYTQGTVSIANGATAVTGTLTGWTSQTLPEDAITFDGGSTWYEIAAVGGNTAITLASPYLGTPIVNGAYKIQRLGRGHGQVSYLAQQVAALLTQFPAFAGIADAGNTWRIKSDGSGWEMCTPAQLLGRHVFTGISGASGMATATGALGEFEVRNSSGGGAFMSFHRVGAQGAYFGVDTDNIWKVGGWTYGAVAYRVVHEGLSGITIPGQIRANVTAGTAWALDRKSVV